jgi:hypothetical protein
MNVFDIIMIELFTKIELPGSLGEAHGQQALEISTFGFQLG